LLVTAAFIGPGTITTASTAGANFGFTLLWALLFSVLATWVLQEMAARVGLVSGQGLAQVLCNTFDAPWINRLALVLVVAAIGFGNAAYEAGNIAGAALGAQSLTGVSSGIWSLLIGGLAGALLLGGRYKLLESVLILLVLLMSAVFVLTMFMVDIDFAALLSGLFKPSMPSTSELTIIALIGTTVVPYNLFLHAAAVREHWGEGVPIDQALRESRWDTGMSIGLGGLITLAVISTSAATFFQTGASFSASSLATQLEPLLGSAATYCFGFGLLAAGLTSAITAPLAAAYAVCGALAWPNDFSDKRFRAVWLIVLLVGTVFAALGTKPLAAIIFAQAANGFLLPIVAVFLLIVMNRKSLLGQYRNTWSSNVLGALVVLVAAGLGIYKLIQVASLV
jgi:Mn2+/Fe2+ NRAMP family transporter